MIVFLESHPVQYRTPVFQRLQELRPGMFKVLFATDCSVRGYRDAGFGQAVQWNVPLLEGYPFEVLNWERGEPLKGARSLHGRDIGAVLDRLRPQAVLFSQFAYEIEWAAVLHCWRRGIRIWMRQETQDEAFVRHGPKTWVRATVYHFLYRFVDRAFYIGELNRAHLLAHGIRPERLERSPYCVRDPFRAMSSADKARRRAKWRQDRGIGDRDFVCGFFGKLIPKKAPDVFLEGVGGLSRRIGSRVVHALMVGAGEMDQILREQATRLGGSVHFAGFVNQAELPDYYLGCDAVVLPSRRLGETWGLVVNEALHAGCAAVVSAAAGCHREFGSWERVRVMPVDDPSALAAALGELAELPRDFDWCSARMEAYSIDAAAQGLARGLDCLPPDVTPPTHTIL